MSSPKTINGLMKHLRNDCGIEIRGSLQKKQLICYGYYHGYKGYRFAKTSDQQIPYEKFSELVAVIEYDNNMKAALYPNLMFIETAIKNVICNVTVDGLSESTFDHVYQMRMSDIAADAKQQSKIMASKLRLRNDIYKELSSQYGSIYNRNSKGKKETAQKNMMISHFYDKGQEVPLWAIFEILNLDTLSRFSECLNISVREEILRQLHMLDIALDTNRKLLSSALLTIKPLRNAVAHNNIIFDTRFRKNEPSEILKMWVRRETGIKNIGFDSLMDYIILVCCLLKHVDYNNRRAEKLLRTYKEQLDILRDNVTVNIYDMVIHPSTDAKLQKVEAYIKS